MTATATPEVLTELHAIGIAPKPREIDGSPRNFIEGVKILGTQSKNGRTYPTNTIEEAVKLYEGVRVNINHPAGKADDPRDYQDRFGYLEEVEVKDDGLFGRLVINPKHPLAEQFLWDATNAPKSVGLSHNITALTENDQDGHQTIKQIETVRSVDIVSNPATSNSLYEQVEQTKQTEPKKEYVPLTEEEGKAAMLAQIKPENKRPEGKEKAVITESCKRDIETEYRKRLVGVQERIKKAGIPDFAIDSLLIDAVLESGQDPKRGEGLIADRKRMLDLMIEQEAKPKSKTPSDWRSDASPASLKDFAKRITR